MNNNILTNNIFNASAQTPYHGRGKNPVLGKGDILNALVLSRENDKVSLMVPDRKFSFELPASEVDGEVGDAVSFEVVSAAKNTLALRQVKAPDGFVKELVKQAGATDIKELMQKSDFVEKDINVLDPKELEERCEELKEKEMRALAQIRRQLSAAVNGTNRAAVRELISAGIDMRKIDLTMLGSAASEIDKNMNIEKTGVIEGNSVETDEAAKILADEDFPATRRNIAVLEDLRGRLNEIKNMDKRLVFDILRSGAELTVENVCRFLPIAPRKAASESPDIPENEVSKLFEREKIVKNPENLKIAELLAKEEIPVSKENIEKYKYLNNAGAIAGGTILRRAVKAMKEGNSALSANIYESDLEKADYSKEIFDKLKYEIRIINAEHIELALMRGDKLSIQNLAGIAARGGNSGARTEAVAGVDNAAKIHAAKRQLAELSLKLTWEAANRLHGKNIEIDTLALSEAVEALRKSENEYLASNLRIMGAEATPENIAKISETMDAVRVLRPTADAVYGGILQKRTGFTISEVGRANFEALLSENARRASLEEVVQAYAPFETTPNPKYGDAFSKIAGKFAPLLESIGVEATRQNIKAAKILSYNEMDVNYENIIRVKTVDAKIGDIYARLHPLIAAEMIREGLNPAGMHADDVLAYIAKFREVCGETPEGKIAEHILETDRNGSLSERERKAVVSTYKMLNIIMRHGSAALGAAVKSGSELTLGSLMELSETLKKPLNAVIDDERGLNIRKAGKESILKILKEASAKPDDFEFFAKRTVESFAEKAAPAALAEYLEKTDNATEASIEAATETLSATEENATSEEARRIAIISQELLGLQNVSAAEAKVLEDADIPTTIQNIAEYHKMSPGYTFGDSLASKKLGKARSRIESALPDAGLKTLVDGSGLEETLGALQAALEETADEISISETGAERDMTLEEINSLVSALRLRYSVLDARGGSFIPVMLNDRPTDVEVYVLNDELENRDDVSVAVFLRTALGGVRADIKVSGNSVSADFILDNMESLQIFENNKESLYTFAENAGFTVESVKFAVK